MKIKNVYGREILDSRGWPTVECLLELDGGISVGASVPSGASVGKHEAVELRDNDKKRFLGKGVVKAVASLEKIIGPALVGRAPDLVVADNLMKELDGTIQKSKLGANAILAASIAVTRAQALVNGVEVYQLFQERLKINNVTMPYCMFNIVNGGAHADNGISFQEFMVVPVGQSTVAAALEVAVRVYQELKKIIKKAGYATTVGDEGGFAPVFTGGGVGSKVNAGGTAEQVLDLLTAAVAAAGLTHENIVFALDVAASQFYDQKSQKYTVDGRQLTGEGLIEIYEKLAEKYPIFSIEDGMAEDDWSGWQLLTKRLGSEVQLVGDDIFVTNQERIKQGIAKKIANAVLIKPNQIGTVSETIQAILLAQGAGYKTVVSHRSGETNDFFIADLVVGTAAGQFKAGAPARGERVVKYNRLMEIEEQLS